MRNIIKQVLKEEIDSKSDRVKSIVNRYGFVNAIKMVVGGVDTIKQAYQYNPESFLVQFNDLTPIQKNDKIYYVDKDRLLLFYYYPNDKNGYVFINNNRIWMFFEYVIGIEYSETQVIIKNWLDEVYGIKGLIPKNPATYYFSQVEREI